VKKVERALTSVVYRGEGPPPPGFITYRETIRVVE